jgi:hypothetical protein
LESKKAAACIAYDKRIAKNTAATQERRRLTADGNAAAAGAVVIGKTNKHIPKSRPAVPPILKTSATPPFCQDFVLFQFGFLSVDASGLLSLRRLIHCGLCVIMENLQEGDWKSIGRDDFE